MFWSASKLSTIDTVELLPGPGLGPSVAEILAWHASGSGSPTKTAARVADAVAARGQDGVWLHTVPRDELIAAAAEIERRPGARTLPLFGVPFAVKDSIDVAGWPTTLACPDYAYVPTETAPVVARLLDAGAILIGKTNLDQFATGLNGTRTPYGVPHSVYGADLISGGSSSGSALAVALGEVPFAVATDTAGSGRVPPALNGILGFKPSRGLISTVGPGAGLPVAGLHQPDGRHGRRSPTAVRHRRRIPTGATRGAATASPRRTARTSTPSRSGCRTAAELEFFGDDRDGRRARARARAGSARRLRDRRPRSQRRSSTPAPCSTRARGSPNGSSSSAVSSTEHPGVGASGGRAHHRGGARFTAVDAFARPVPAGRAQGPSAAAVFRTADVLVVPTIGTTFTIDQVLADPIATNTMLGHYTHFGNLLDLCAAAVPAGTTDDGRPASCMVLGPALADDVVLALAARLRTNRATDREPMPSPIRSPRRTRHDRQERP